MIQIDRKKVKVPKALAFAMRDPAGERAKVRASYPPAPAKPPKSYTFAAYKDDTVKRAIETLFNNKCAYCETLHGAGGPVDIEHYRPKGEVLDDKAHPGYWWVAMEWTNLLYSCIDCNRMRGQVIVTPGMTHAEVEVERQKPRRTNAGKKDAFPIRGKRLQPEKLTYVREDPLLIDPTRTDPTRHLTFVADAEDRCLVVARETPDGPDPYGQTSIQVFGLNRSVLVDARSMRWKELRVQGEFIKDFLDEFTYAASTQAKERAIGRARKVWRELESWADSKKPYSGMVRVFLADLKLELGWDDALAGG